MKFYRSPENNDNMVIETKNKVFTMIPPTVKHIRNVSALAFSDEKKELLLFAVLCDSSEEELENLLLSDYMVLQQAYFELVRAKDE